MLSQQQIDLTVQGYNVTVRSFPSNLTAMLFGYKENPTFAVDNEREIAKPPSVGFDTAPAKPAGPGSGQGDCMKEPSLNVLRVPAVFRGRRCSSRPAGV